MQVSNPASYQFILNKEVMNARDLRIVAAMFEVSPEQIFLPGWSKYDKRSAVNKNVKARVMVIRPRWDEWSVDFTLSVDEDSIQQEMIERIITYAGKYVGIGSYRPQNKGRFGLFELTSIEQV